MHQDNSKISIKNEEGKIDPIYQSKLVEYYQHSKEL